MAQRKPEVVVLGLDGATFAVIDALGPAVVPALHELMARGGRATLQSITPPISPGAWAAITTGCYPGKSGICEFLALQPGTYSLRIVRSTWAAVPRLWDYLGAAGLSCGVLQVPITYPAQALSGFLIAGLGAPGLVGGFAYPQAVGEELLRAVPDYQVSAFARLRQRPPRDLAEVAELVLRQCRCEAEAIRWALRRGGIDVLFGVVQQTDIACHFFWPTDAVDLRDALLQTPIAEVYSIADRLVADVLDFCGEAADIIVLSDHGQGPLLKEMHLNVWLQERGYLVVRPVGAGRRGLGTALEWGRRHLPWLAGMVRRGLPGLHEKLLGGMSLGPVVWARTRAFAVGTQIFINARGRFPDGCVDPADVAALKREIAEALQAEVDPDSGERVVGAVLDGDEVFAGPCRQRFGDLVVIGRGHLYFAMPRLRPPSSWLTPPLQADVAPGSWRAHHRPDGIIVWAGPRLAPTQINGARCADITPTVLRLLGFQPPPDMDGRVLDVLAEPPPVHTALPPLAPGEHGADVADDQQEVKRHLEGLGYL